MSDTIYSYEAPFLRAALGQIKDFLLSKEIFWNLGLKSPKGHPPYPQLSLGNALLSFERLLALKKTGLLSKPQMLDIDEIALMLESLKNEWTSAWEAKVKNEYGLRLRQWARFVNEMSKSSQPEAGSFSSGLRNRAVMQTIKSDLPNEGTALLSEVASLDQHFKQLSKGTDFVWEKELKLHFSPDEYWFLYTQANN